MILKTKSMMKWFSQRSVSARVLASVAVFVLGSAVAVACSCIAPGTPAEEADKYDAVFTGIVTNVSENPASGDFTSLYASITVARAWKNVESGDTVSVATASNSAMCGVYFQNAVEYLIYARVSDDGQLVAESCSRTSQLSSVEQSELDALDAHFGVSVSQWDDTTKEGLMCSECGPLPTIAAEAQQSDVVFMGAVTAHTLSADGASRNITFDVAKRYKGLVANESEIIKVAATQQSCGPAFVVGRAYIVYATRGVDDQIVIDQCSRTKPFLNARNEAKELDTIFDVDSDEIDPFVTIMVEPTEIAAGEDVTVTWSAQNVWWCSAKDDWFGFRRKSGTKTRSHITEEKTYTISCRAGLTKTVSQSVTVGVKDVVTTDDGVDFSADYPSTCRSVSAARAGMVNAGVDASTNVDLMRAMCAETGTQLAIAGPSLDKVYYTWRRIYYAAPGADFTEGNSMLLSGSLDPTGEWVRSVGSAVIPTTDDVPRMTVAAYICAWDGVSWSCGCDADGNCSDPANDAFQWTMIDVDRTVADEVIPAQCTSWYDGCNTCSVESDGTLGVCTLRACIQHDVPKCLAYADDVDADVVCRATGCSNHICASADDDTMTTCEWREEYACYADEGAVCEVQADGECGWTQTEELTTCIADANEAA